MKYERKFVNISAFRRAALLSVSRRDTARSVALLRGRKDALLSDAEFCKDVFQYFIGSYLAAGNLGESVESLSEVFAEEIGRE